ncbi:ankyrin repeat-containing protein ITN1 isoform X1 [Daucus carota subsp. sativus]
MNSIKRDAISRQIYKAAIQDDWDSVSHIFETENWRLNAEISLYGETPLHIAVGTNSSHRFVEKLVKMIVTSGNGVGMLRTTIKVGRPYNALHLAGKRGNCKDAKLLVDYDPEFPQTVVSDDGGTTPLEMAAWKGHKETVHYLLSVTRDEVGLSGTSPFRGTPGANILTQAIATGLYDVALYLVEKYPDLVGQTNYTGSATALSILATKRNDFPSGCHLTFWQHIIYSRLDDTEVKVADIESGGRGPARTLLRRIFGKAPYVKHIRQIKATHLQTEQLVKQICSTLIMNFEDTTTWKVLGHAIHIAVRHGTHELIEECIRNYPELIRYEVEGLNLFKAAINHRQEKVFNLMYQISAHSLDTMAKVNGENALHLAANLAPYHRLRTVTGVALQMQRELLWFKEVDKFMEPAQRVSLNNEKKTPRMLFTDEHRQLLTDAQQWTQNTSSSSTVVAALLVTIAFAALFTVPGGNKDSDGQARFLTDAVFLLFVISDAIALFSSATSVLMFLSTLTHSSQEDFLYALPLRLTLGLISLFISVATTMVAFSATLVLVLRDKIQWIAVPVTLMACIPILLFLWLQYPLLLELVRATFGKNIFGQQNNLLLH